MPLLSYICVVQNSNVVGQTILEKNSFSKQKKLYQKLEN